MANRLVYCTEAAIRTHIGTLKLPSEINLDSAAEAASNEVDGFLGTRYTVPIVVSVSDPAEKNSAYWLQQVTSLIAGARILLSAAAPGSQDTANNYGKYLLKNAMEMIQAVVEGKRNLPGAIESEDGMAQNKGPVIVHGDAYSQVDMFYDNFEPEGFAPGRNIRPGGIPWPR